MAASSLIEMQSYRKRKSRSRLIEALDRFYTEVLLPANQENLLAHADEYEEFTAEILAEHLTEKLQSARDIRGLDQQYRQFDQRLRQALQRKFKSLALFESMQPT
jgi:hypothetical protein